MDTTIRSAQTKQLKFWNKYYFKSLSITKILVTADVFEILKFFGWKPTHSYNVAKTKIIKDKKINPTFFLFVLDKKDYKQEERLVILQEKMFSSYIFCFATPAKFRKKLAFLVGRKENHTKTNQNHKTNREGIVAFRTNTKGALHIYPALLVCGDPKIWYSQTNSESS